MLTQSSDADLRDPATDLNGFQSIDGVYYSAGLASTSIQSSSEFLILSTAWLDLDTARRLQSPAK